MQTTAPSSSSAPDHFDVLVVGAGISGIGAARHLATQCPGKTFVVLEKMHTFGGTWVTHKYPGVRSDSDLYTFGYRFKPWVGPPVATAPEILKYLGEVIDEGGLAPHIRYRHAITGARWSSRDKRWTVEATNAEDGSRQVFTAGFLWMCQGYYNHEQGYTPEWPGMSEFRGRIVHPQTWPDDVDLHGKHVVVIGSGATAATLVPAIAGDCAHVTLLQRSPTYFHPAPNQNELADLLRLLKINEEWIHHIVREKLLYDQREMTRRSREEPEVVKAELLDAARAIVGPEVVAQHFTPSYRPWQQRMAYIPDGDLFVEVASGKADVVTDHIERFTPKGILLKSGRELEADVVVTATGFNLSVLGDIPFEVDGRPVDWARTITYRGMMFTGVPNMAWVFGYFRASWTLRVDLVADVVCRLLRHMDARHAQQVEVVLRPEDRGDPVLPWIDADNFNPGYLMRRIHLMPRRLDKPQWQHNQDYWTEKDELPAIDLSGSEFVYS